jgi:hypothetical protein
MFCFTNRTVRCIIDKGFVRGASGFSYTRIYSSTNKTNGQQKAEGKKGCKEG